MEPKSTPGPLFSGFGDPLFSCNPTVVLLDFKGFEGPRDDPRRGKSAIPAQSPAKNKKKTPKVRILCPKVPKMTSKRMPKHLLDRTFGPSCWSPWWKKRPGCCPDGQKSAPGLEILRKSYENLPRSLPAPEKKEAIICP